MNFREYDPDESKIVFAIDELNQLVLTEKLFLNELARTITDTNMYQICFILENEAPLAQTTSIPNVILPAILLYAQKLELMIGRLAKDLLTSEDLLYDLMPKEALREALLTTYSDDTEIDESHIRKIIQVVNRRAMDKAFKQGVGALQEEVWRLRDEEGQYVESEEDKVTELLTMNFINI